MPGISALFGTAIWRMVKNVVVLRKNWRALEDPEFTNLLQRVRKGIAWDGRVAHTAAQLCDGRNYSRSDYNILQTRLLQTMSPTERAEFADAPIIVATKVVRDLVNRRLVKNYANKVGLQVDDYCSRDRFSRVDVAPSMRDRLWKIRSSLTKDALGKIPMVPGMKVMITENVAIKAKAVNGQEGTLVEVKYDIDECGNRYAKCAYVRIPGCGYKTWNQDEDVVPIVPVTTYFKYVTKEGGSFSIARSQLPLVPAYAYTDYKAQGRSLTKVTVDLAGSRSLQGLYVMLSRATALKNLAIFRQFDAKKVYKRLSEEFRSEFDRIDNLDAETRIRWDGRRRAVELSQY
ncbi:hypothetical protein C8R44DRAFT_613972 [Mycena epipterygia]|nr:hypothetical protein C8R44DRAFT_613972 [Mycena epipterygia]